MNIRHLRTLGEVADFLQGSQSLEPMDATQAERYQWIEYILRHFQYVRLGRPDKGLLIAYLGAITGYSRQQTTRLIRRYRDHGVTTLGHAPDSWLHRALYRCRYPTVGRDRRLA